MAYYYIGSAPYEETPVLQTDPDFSTKQAKEAQVYKDQITRHFGPPVGDAKYWIKTDSEFKIVMIEFNSGNVEESDFAEKVQEGLPKWDEQSLKALS